MLVTSDNVGQCLESIERAPALYADAETTGLRPYDGDKAIGWGVKIPASDAYYFPIRHDEGNISDKHRKILLRILSKKPLTNHHTKFDLQFIWNEGVETYCPSHDTMVGAHLIDENRRGFKLEFLAAEIMGPKAWTASNALDKILAERMLGKDQMQHIHPSEVEPYGCMDVRLAELLDVTYRKELDRQDLLSVYDGVSKYSDLIGRMELRGIAVDLDHLAALSSECQAQCIQLRGRAREMAGRAVNLDSPQAVGKWLGIVGSTDDDALKHIATPEAELVREYREWAKSNGTYLRKFLSEHVDGIIHPNLSLTRVITGRLATRGIPLLALPKHNSRYRVKEAMVARPGYGILQADYDRAEMCMGTHYSNDFNMKRLLKAKVDVHGATASGLGVDRDRVAKPLNFSAIYQIGSFSMADDLGITEPEAAEYLKKWNAEYPGFKNLHRRCQDRAYHRRRIIMYTGRRRHYNKGPHFTPYHRAMSNLIQGCVGEVIRERQTAVDDSLRPFDVHQLLQIHDSAVMEYPLGTEEKIIPAVRELMEDHRFAVPMTVTIKVGPNFHECKEI